MVKLQLITHSNQLISDYEKFAVFGIMAAEENFMERFLLFAGETYYPQAGMGNFIDSFPYLGEAIEKAANIECDWWNIYDIRDERPLLVKYGTR